MAVFAGLQILLMMADRVTPIYVFGFDYRGFIFQRYRMRRMALCALRYVFFFGLMGDIPVRSGRFAAGCLKIFSGFGDLVIGPVTGEALLRNCLGIRLLRIVRQYCAGCQSGCSQKQRQYTGNPKGYGPSLHRSSFEVYSLRVLGLKPKTRSIKKLIVPVLIEVETCKLLVELLARHDVALSQLQEPFGFIRMAVRQRLVARFGVGVILNRYRRWL